MTLKELHEYMAHIRELRAAAEAEGEAAKTAQNEYKQAEHILFEEMRAAEMGSTTAVGYRWQPMQTPYPQILDKEAMMEWFEEHEPESILKTVAPGRINEIMHEHLDAEPPTPMPEWLSFYMKDYVSQTKVAKKR